MKPSRAFALAGIAATMITAALAHGGSFGGNPAVDGTGWSPRVPVSGFARQMVGIDPSRLHFSTSVSVGTGFGGKGEGLQVTSLSYQFASPLAMRVSLGNAFGSSSMRGGSSFFLEGLDLAYRPSANTMFSIHYQNMRSPLQYRGAWGDSYWAP